MSTAYLFPGQGSQYVGMGKALAEENQAIRETFEQANAVLGIDLISIMFDGPEDQLKQTEYTQPAIFLHSVALFNTLNVQPDRVAGHSLGEFSALVAAKAISFEDGLRIVRKRGQLMQHAGTMNPGTMAAIIGLDDEVVESLCEKATEETGKEVVPANYNCPGQLVISGYVEAVERAVALAPEAGARMAKVLPVSGAFHSSLMQLAYDGLKEELEALTIHVPVCPVYSNYTAKPTSDPDVIRRNALNQLLNPVKWTQTLLQMDADGTTSYVEVGPGKVLQGLVKRTHRKAEISGYQ
ncbi:MAG: ACP S-malonyltransferase [Bacteroidota bacterium]